MRATVRCAVCSSCLTLLAFPDSVGGGLGRARVVSLGGALPGFGKLSSQICSGNMTWTCSNLRRTLHDFSQQASSFVLSTAVCSATFRRDLLLQLLNPYHIISAVTLSKPPPSSRFRVLFFVSCVMSIYLSIDLPVPQFRVTCCCWLRLLCCCYTSSRHIITQHLLVGRVGGPGRGPTFG